MELRTYHIIAIAINLITQGLARDYRAVKIKPMVHWGKIRKSIVIKLLEVDPPERLLLQAGIYFSHPL